MYSVFKIRRVFLLTKNCRF